MDLKIKRKQIMKRMAMLFALIVSGIIFSNCEGPEGPPGPTVYPYVTDIKLNFDGDLNANIASQLVRHDVKLYQGDVVLIFVMEDTDNEGNPIWSPLPQRYFVYDNATQQDEELEYIYNYGVNDFEIIARATAPLDIFNGNGSHPGFLKNMIFRIIYVPGADPVQKFNSTNSSNSEIHSLSYDEVVAKYNLQNINVVKKY